VDYYKSDKSKPCDIKYFGNDKFLPLYLSFENKHQVKVTLRIEQKILTYNVKYLGSHSFITRNKNVYEIYLIKHDTLKLRYNGNLVLFKRVSYSYSVNVFDQFIKDIIFKEIKSYKIASFTENYKYLRSVITASNFNEKMKAIFSCQQVEFAQLASFQYGNSCLPEIALYGNTTKLKNPRELGIKVENNNIKFIDKAGNIILILEPNL
jgi:hypothetical protein